jgi:hypothetical protein
MGPAACSPQHRRRRRQRCWPSLALLWALAAVFGCAALATTAAAAAPATGRTWDYLRQLEAGAHDARHPGGLAAEAMGPGGGQAGAADWELDALEARYLAARAQALPNAQAATAAAEAPPGAAAAASSSQPEAVHGEDRQADDQTLAGLVAEAAAAAGADLTSAAWSPLVRSLVAVLAATAVVALVQLALAVLRRRVKPAAAVEAAQQPPAAAAAAAATLQPPQEANLDLQPASSSAVQREECGAGSPSHALGGHTEACSGAREAGPTGPCTSRSPQEEGSDQTAASSSFAAACEASFEAAEGRGATRGRESLTEEGPAAPAAPSASGALASCAAFWGPSQLRQSRREDGAAEAAGCGAPSSHSLETCVAQPGTGPGAAPAPPSVRPAAAYRSPAWGPSSCSPRSGPDSGPRAQRPCSAAPIAGTEPEDAASSADEAAASTSLAAPQPCDVPRSHRSALPHSRHVAGRPAAPPGSPGPDTLGLQLTPLRPRDHPQGLLHHHLRHCPAHASQQGLLQPYSQHTELGLLPHSEVCRVTGRVAWTTNPAAASCMRWRVAES